MPRKTDKRVRLIEAAKILIHQQGFNLTTLADIAQEADVPLGNVYYYFKTKEAIGVAVIEKWASEWTERLARWETIEDPLARLFILVRHGLDNLEMVARFGCPIGGLCQELGKQGGALSDLAAKLLHDILQWTEAQFRALGIDAEKAADYGLTVTSTIQGMYLLTHTFKDPKIAEKQAKSLEDFLARLIGRRPEVTTKMEEVAYAEEA